MSSSSVAISEITLFTGGHGASTSHPMVTPTFQQPFTLLATNGEYRLTFFNPNINNPRVYAKGFSTSSSDILWWSSVDVPKRVGNDPTYAHISFSLANLNGSTQLWVGSWWDDGTYPATLAGITAYFTDHPESGGHHTVPILVQ